MRAFCLSEFLLAFSYASSAFNFFGSSSEMIFRIQSLSSHGTLTIIGKITFRYLPCTYTSRRTSSALSQMKLTMVLRCDDLFVLSMPVFVLYRECFSWHWRVLVDCEACLQSNSRGDLQHKSQASYFFVLRFGVAHFDAARFLFGVAEGDAPCTNVVIPSDSNSSLRLNSGQ